MIDTLSHRERHLIDAVFLIGEERLRQFSEEGWTAQHDDQHRFGELLVAGRCYLLATGNPQGMMMPAAWPWHSSWWKPADRARNLAKAGALAWAEADRLRRAGLHIDDAQQVLLEAATELATLPHRLEAMP